MDELKPCPFCGSDEIMRLCDPAQGLDNSGPSRALSCAGCHIEAPFYDTEAEAIAAWNRRTPTPEAGEVERLRAALERWQAAFRTGRHEPMQIAFEAARQALNQGETS